MAGFGEARVLDEVSAELGLPRDKLAAHADDTFKGTGPVWSVVTRAAAPGGAREWKVVRGEREARAMALANASAEIERAAEDAMAGHHPGASWRTAQKLDDAFLAAHVDTKRLRANLHEVASDINSDYVWEQAASNVEGFWENTVGTSKLYADDILGIPIPMDKEGVYRPPTERELEQVARALTNNDLRDPMAYLVRIHEADTALEEMLRFGGLDLARAAKDALERDGFAAYLGIDGKVWETPSGFVYWRSA